MEICMVLLSLAFQSSNVLESEIVAAQDNTLYESESGGLSNGAGNHFFVGLTNADSARRGLIQFDIAGKVQANSKVVDVELKLYVSKVSNTLSRDIALHRVNRDWGESTSTAPGEEGMGGTADNGDATWLHRFYDDEPWLFAGGDFDSKPTHVFLVSTTGHYFVSRSAGLINDVQQWLDDPASNFGWVLVGEEGGNDSAKRFNTREHPVADRRPSLIIQYIPPVLLGDINRDGLVDLLDVGPFVQLLQRGDFQIEADINGDGLVNLNDVAGFVELLSSHS